MSPRRVVQNPNTFLKQYDRFFISTSAIDTVEKARYLVDAFKNAGITPDQGKGVIIINKNVKYGFIELHPEIRSAFVEPLVNMGLLNYESSITRANISYKELVSKLRLEKNRKESILLITNDEKEGVDFEELDLRNNKLNDFDAAGFSINNSAPYSWILFDAVLPPENITFDLVIDLPLTNNYIKVSFYKETSKGNVKNPIPDVVISQINNTEYRFNINKWLLFESSSISFEIMVENQKYNTPLISFIFDEKQKWYIYFDSPGRLKATQDTVKYNKEKIPFPIAKDSNTFSYAYEGNDDFDNYISSKDIILDSKLAPEHKYEDLIAYDSTNTLDPNTVNHAQLEQFVSRNIVLYDDDKKPIKLIKFIKAGGGGAIFLCDRAESVVKIVFKNEKTLLRLSKLKYMIANKDKIITNKYVVWPTSIVYDSANETNRNFVGFLMPCIKSPSGIGNLNHLAVDLKSFNLTKLEILDLAISICQIVSFMHKKKIVINDFKFQNLMIKDEDFNKPVRDFSKVYIVDTDSSQIGKYTNDIYSPEFIAPEVKFTKEVDKNGKDRFGIFHYRRIESDLYSLFVALFKLFMLGQFPYYCTSSKYPEKYDEIEEDFKCRYLAQRGYFPYSLDEKFTQENAPKTGKAAIRWSHLPSYIKEAFINSASKNGANYHPKNRLSAAKWAELLIRYRNDLEELKLRDPEYNVGYPDNFISYEKVKLTEKMRIMRHSIDDFVISAYKSMGLIEPDTNSKMMVKHDLLNNGKYENEKIVIQLIRNLGILYEGEIKKKNM